MSTTTLIEQIKDDLGYLKLTRTAEVFADLAERRAPRGPARVPGQRGRRGGRRHPPTPPLRPAAVRPLPRSADHRGVRLRLPALHRPQRSSTTSPSSTSCAPGPRSSCSANPGAGRRHLGDRARDQGGRGRLSRLLHRRDRHDRGDDHRVRRRQFNHKIRTYTGPCVLVIDDVGITPFDRAQANAFFQVVNRRYEHRSATIVTTNRGLPAWAELFGGDTVVAAAILDRLLDRATVINIKGPSWRLREHQALTKPIKDLNDPPEKPPRGRGLTSTPEHDPSANFGERKPRISVSGDRSCASTSCSPISSSGPRRACWRCTASASTAPRPCLPPPATTPSGCAPKRPGHTSAACHRSKRHRAKS